MKRMFLLILTIAWSSAFATTEYAKTIKQLGVQNAPSAIVAYFSVAEGLTLDCQFGNIYVDITTDFGKAAYEELLAAKSNSRTLSRIDYTQSGGPGTECILSLVEIHN